MKNFLNLSLLFFLLALWPLAISAEVKVGEILLESRVIARNKINFYQLAREDENESPFILSIRDAATDKELHRHILEEVATDCNSISVELGAYNVIGKQITFYSYWAYAGDTPASVYGFRKQIYEFNKENAVVLNKGLISISPAGSGYGGAELISTQIALDVKDPTDEQRKILIKGLADIKSNYQADLIPRAQLAPLEKEVRAILKDQIALHTEGWDQDKIMKKFGVRK